jgi:hypothetical protein
VPGAGPLSSAQCGRAIVLALPPDQRGPRDLDSKRRLGNREIAALDRSLERSPSRVRSYLHVTVVLAVLLAFQVVWLATLIHGLVRLLSQSGR